MIGHLDQQEEKMKKFNQQLTFEELKLKTFQELVADVNEIKNYMNTEIQIDSADDLLRYYKNFYRPQENPDHILIMTTQIIVLSAYYQDFKLFSESQLYQKLLHDVKKYLQYSQSVDPNYLAVCLKFMKDVVFPITNMSYLSENVYKQRNLFNEIINLIISRASKDLNLLNIGQISYISRNLQIQYKKKPMFVEKEVDEIRVEFNEKVDQYLIHKYKNNERIDKINGIRLLIGQSNNNMMDRDACIAVESLLYDSLLELKQENPSQPILSRQEFLDIVNAFTRRKSYNKDLWILSLKQLSFFFKSQEMRLSDLTILTYNLYVMKLYSPKLYQMIVDYFLKQRYSETEMCELRPVMVVNFILSMSYMHKTLENDEFFKVVRAYIINNLDSFNKLLLTKLLDVFKYNQKFSLINQNLKLLLEKELEKKVEQKISESEEEEFKMLRQDLSNLS
ncbi:UNKNOWN [Stylonychia lemnae]|uniref:Uncharacterized protein n=1 Tax=Stylonychia lemnae TaxID=5949 RepID=A0A078AC24_STYLE|nr:UNKNOWN [Stylonychia lemnae]|eukprot:CDW79840.1 UNKNOWN [Stylonychia lemnae]